MSDDWFEKTKAICYQNSARENRIGVIDKRIPQLEREIGELRIERSALVAAVAVTKQSENKAKEAE